MSALRRLLSLSARSGADRDTSASCLRRTGSSSSATRLPSGASPASSPAAYASDPLDECRSAVTNRQTARPALPFDLVGSRRRNLREERYRQNGYNFLQKSTSRLGRPAAVLPVAAVDGRRRAQASAEGALERLGQDSVPALAGGPLGRHADGERDDARAEGAGPIEHSLHLVLAGRGVRPAR